MLKKIKLNFKISELIYSDTAIKNGIYNMPTAKELDCLLELITNILQPIREHFNCPVKVNSGYRNKKLNKLLGGVDNSQHTLGQAADIIVPGQSIENVIKFIKNNLIFDQVINEHNRWVHVSYNPNGKNRGQALKIK